MLTYDVEGNALELQDVTKIHCLCTYDSETGQQNDYYNDGFIDTIADGVGHLAAASHLIAHNQIWYDLPVLKKLYGFEPKGEVIDTLIMSRYLNPDRVTPFNYEGPDKNKPHSITVWSFRLGKKPKIQIEDWSKFTPEMLQRCKEDVMTNWEVYQALLKEAQA